MSTSSNNVEASNIYNVHVKAFCISQPHVKTLTTPRVTVCWRVYESYQLENSSTTNSIDTHKSDRSYLNQFSSISSTDNMFMSHESRDVISGMLSGLKLPFELDRLTWVNNSDTGDKITRQLLNVDDMISNILEVINSEVALGHMRVCVIMEIRKEHIVGHEEYEAMRSASSSKQIKKLSSGAKTISMAEREKEMAGYIVSVDNQARRSLADPSNQRVFGAIRRSCEEYYMKIHEEMRKYNVSEERVMAIVRSMEPEAMTIRESFDEAEAKFTRIPASKESIMALEKCRLKDGDERTCVICKEDMHDFEVISMPCSHVYHEDCIVRWLEGYDHRCPLCKFSLPKQEEQ